MERFDVTVPINPSVHVFNGDPDVRLERTLSIASGGICNLSRLTCGVHTGTHIDAPVHFIDGASGVDATPLDALIGSAYVVDATQVDGDIDSSTLATLEIPIGAARLLFKTRNSELWAHPAFRPDFIGITGDAARILADRDIRLVGVDYLSVAPNGDPVPTHVNLLSSGVVILEGLDLREVEAGWYELLCLPLLLEGADGAPARALLTKE